MEDGTLNELADLLALSAGLPANRGNGMVNAGALGHKGAEKKPAVKRQTNNFRKGNSDMKQSRKGRLFRLLLCLVLALSMFSSNVAAVTVPKEDAEFESNGDYQIEDVRYYQAGTELNTYQQNFDLYKDMLTSPNYDYEHGRSIVEDWFRLAVWISKHHSDTNAPYIILQKAAYYDEGGARFIDGKPNKEETFYTGKNDKDKYDTYTSGLQWANSMAAAEGKMRDFAYKVYKDAGGTDDFTWETSKLSDDDETQPVYYFIVRGGKESRPKGHGPGLGIVFSDFKLVPIFPDQADEKAGYDRQSLGTSEEVSGTYQMGATNDTDSVATAEQSLEQSTTAEVSSEYTKGKEYSWEEGIEVGAEWGSSVFGATYHLNLNFSASQAISESWSTGTSASDSTSVASTVSVEMPPYTRVLLKSSTAQETYKETWTTPMALNYKVTIIDYSIDMKNGAKDHDHAEIIASFPKGGLYGEPGNARESLRYRYERRDTLKEPDLDWDSIISKSSGSQYGTKTDVGYIIDPLSKSVPMVPHAADVRSVIKTTLQKVSGFTALYPMTQIVSSNGVMEYNLNNGECIFPQTIDIQGLNKKNAPFYGFDPTKGGWILTDETGRDVSETSEIAKLITEPVTGTIKLVAGNTDGTVYLTYAIDEEYYKDIYTGPDSPITNESLEKPYKVPINVTDTTMKGGSITVTGSQSIVAGDPPAAPKLSLDIRNAYGREVHSNVHWYANDLYNIEVINDMFSASKELKPGYYPVVAYIGNEDNPMAWSAPHDIEVLGARKLSELTVDSTSFELNPQNLTVDLSSLEVHKFDQYHNTEYDRDYNPNYPESSVWNGDESIVWTCDDEKVTIDENGLATFPAGNATYILTAAAKNAEGETVTSNDLTVTVSGFVDITGTAISWDGADNAEYLLYPAEMDEEAIIADAWDDEHAEALPYTAVKSDPARNSDNERFDQAFSFESVLPGEYKLAIVKPGKYVPKVMEIKSGGEEAIDLGEIKLWLYGDVNYDGEVDVNDSTQLIRYLNLKPSVFDREDDAEDRFAAADVFADGMIDINDSTQIIRFINLKASIFNTLK